GGPNDATGERYELRFRASGAGTSASMLGRSASPFTDGLQRITVIVVQSGATLQGLNLPIHPNGVIYNSVARTPVVGATLTLLDGRSASRAGLRTADDFVKATRTLLDAGSASPLPAGCFDDPAQQGQITLADGYYKFDINFSDAAAC